MRTVTTIMRRGLGMVILVMLFAFVLQGCHTPFVNVEVKAGPGCEAGADSTRSSSGLCLTDTAVGQQVNGLTCNSGVICEDEGEDHCRGNKVCTTGLVSGFPDKCSCKCKKP